MPGKSFLFVVLTLVAVAACIPTPTPALTPATSPVSPPLPTSTPTIELVSVTVYFTDRDLYVAGTPPFEAAVVRQVPETANLPEAVLQAFFAGPTSEEQAQGLEAITSGFDGFNALVIEGGIARVYLTGKCASLGATYSVAQPVMRNLLQFPEVAYVKIYDENGTTEQPEGETSSIPFCLEP